MRRQLVATALSVVWFAGPLLGQDREQLVREAADEFNPARAIELLHTALDPSLGPPDSVWGLGAQWMAFNLYDADRRDEATAWLRWAARLHPDILVDTLTFGSDVVDALRAAKAFVAAQAAPPPTVFATRWEWAPDRGDARGTARLDGTSLPAGINVVIEGFGVLDGSADLDVGSYVFVASAAGFAETRAPQEILPGVTTVLRFDLPIAVVAPELPAATRSAALAQLVSIDANAVGETFCGTGYWARPGIVVTSYTAIRGAETLALRLSTGQTVADPSVAAYDVAGNLAALYVDAGWADSLPLSPSVSEDQPVWVLGREQCGAPAARLTRVLQGGDASVTMADSAPGLERGGTVIDQSGAVAGVGVSDAAAAAPGSVDRLVARAQSAIADRDLIAAREVARLERHRLGIVTLESPMRSGATARVDPLETWHWEGLGGTQQLPWRFVGPEGRYDVTELFAGAVRNSGRFTIQPGVVEQLAMDQLTVSTGGGFPWPVAGVVGGAGIIAAVVLGGGPPDDPTPTGPGTVIFVFPPSS